MEPDDIKPGEIITGFALQTPLTDAICRDQIAQSIASGVPDAVGRRRLAVIANGPSARGIDLRAITQPTLALNGSIKLFLEQGVTPTYWACCDPQAIVADFLPDEPPTDTTYLIASKCHPSVRAKLLGRDARLWHLSDQPAPGKYRISVCSSVTLSAAWLMHRMGFTDFDFYGWDGCFMDGRDHAAHSNGSEPTLHLNYGGKIVGDEIIGGRTFATSRTWAAEAESAQQFFQLAKYFGIGVTIHGDGMFKCVQDSLLADEPHNGDES